jgi:protein-disulfide isomerase
MFDTARVRLLTALLPLAALAAACSQREAPQTPARQVTASPGEVAAATGPVKFDDSVSAHADRARIRGSEGAQVWLVEISDFQCPFCKQWHDETFAKIDQEYVKTGKVRLAYLNFPLSRIHKNAQAAAEAAMCAGVQGKFWELHESLFQTQPKWADLKSPLAVFDSLARAAKVEPKGWGNCMSTHATAKLIQADRDRSTQAGVESTPTFFIADRALAGAYPVDTFRVVLDQALAKAKGAAH